MLTYENCGVSPEKNDKLVNVISGISGVSTGFADVQSIPNTDLSIVQCTDGVGTKIHLAKDYTSLYSTIGQDLVAMCVNDLICTGATPAYFQDYIGMNTLQQDVVRDIITSITNACESCGVTLTGGEMAEMPGSYIHDIPELVGFATGFLDKEHYLGSHKVKEGDLLIALPSSGPHSNGYTLIRKVMENANLCENIVYSILEPTAIYIDVANFHQSNPNIIHAMAHITGGGLEANLSRVIPDGLRARIDYNRWQVPEVFDAICEIGDVKPESMWSTFNMGIGMVMICNTTYLDLHQKNLQHAFSIGEIVSV